MRQTEHMRGEMITHCDCTHQDYEHRTSTTGIGIQVTFIEFLNCTVEGCDCTRFHRADF